MMMNPALDMFYCIPTSLLLDISSFRLLVRHRVDLLRAYKVLWPIAQECLLYISNDILSRIQELLWIVSIHFITLQSLWTTKGTIYIFTLE